MKAQDVIGFPEQADDSGLLAIFERQCQVSLLALDMAKQLYRARAIWIGGVLLDWDDLTMGAKARYRAEVEALIKGGNQ
jgi:hypothetical protein